MTFNGSTRIQTWAKDMKFVMIASNLTTVLDKEKPKLTKITFSTD